MKKILIIGQAPPLQKQEVPYDTTMLYEWLGECGVSKEQAQDMFIFEAMTDKAPSVGSNGHIAPGEGEMMAYFRSKLSTEIVKCDKIILLGNVSREFFNNRKPFKGDMEVCTGKEFLCLMHPSNRNRFRFEQKREAILSTLKRFIHKNLIESKR